MSGKLILLLGGARSGKTRHAQNLAAQFGGDVTYVATAEPGDDEMRARIAAHRVARPAGWQTMERPLRLGDALTDWDATVVVVDCLTLLVSNILSATGGTAPAGTRLPAASTAVREAGELAPAALVEANVESELSELLTAWRDAEFHLIVVSNEVGLGLVPETALGRVYRDALGRANQQLAQAADEVYFMVAGLPLKIK
jgi:adenosylcobinamide kinase/adenosylcobinamide-phosphate guanylyltransferase